MKMQELLTGLFVFLMIFETVYALATNDLSLLSNHFKGYINDLNVSVVYSRDINGLGNWDFKYGILNLNFNFLRDFISYLIFPFYYIITFFITLFSVIYYLFVIFYYPFAILPSPFNTIMIGAITGLIVITIITEVRVMNTSLGGGS